METVILTLLAIVVIWILFRPVTKKEIDTMIKIIGRIWDFNINPIIKI